MPNPTLEEADRMPYGTAEWYPGKDLVFVAEQSAARPARRHSKNRAGTSGWVVFLGHTQTLINWAGVLDV